MRIVLDFQACQSASRYRGIGRGSRSLMLAMANALIIRGHEVICLLSEVLNENYEELHEDIRLNVPKVSFASFNFPSPCAAAIPENAWRQMAARMLREHALACLEPDFVHVPTLLADGWGDDAVGSIGLLGLHIPTSITQHDLIPLAMADMYMPPGLFHDYYMDKLEYVKKADLIFAISEYSKQEAISMLGLPIGDVIHISSAADDFFKADLEPYSVISTTLQQYDLKPGFLLYAPGGFDPRKNLDRLLEAYSLLPLEVRSSHQLVIASKLDDGRRIALNSKAKTLEISASDLVLTDYISDDDLRCLYQACHLYIFPSLHEGFGLPALEAMRCGAPVIASNRTSIPEVIGMEESLFDPFDSTDIANKILQVISDRAFRERLINHAKTQPHKFSWGNSAQIAVNALEQRFEKLKCSGWRKVLKSEVPSCDEMLKKLCEAANNPSPTVRDISVFTECYFSNRGK